MASRKKKLANGITDNIIAHCFNKDRSQVAVAPNTNDLLIYSTNGKPTDASKWSLEQTLSEHQRVIMGVDWCHKTNQIVTCGQDRNAYVWTHNGKRWEKNQVILRINRAATCVRWTVSGTKFAVGSGSKEVSVCRFEKSQNFWVARQIKKHKSTILCLDWHPNNVFLLTGGADFKTRIFSGYLRQVDKKSQLEGFTDIFSDKVTKLGDLLMEFDQSKGWIESLSWSPSGYDFAFTGHDSSVNFVSLKDSKPQTLHMSNLPLRSLVFLSDSLCVGGGYDKTPYVFALEDSKWVCKGALDKGNTEKKAIKSGGAFSSGFDVFSNATQGKKFGDTGAVSLKTRHQNTITEIRAWSETEFSSSGMDGCVFHWEISGTY